MDVLPRSSGINSGERRIKPFDLVDLTTHMVKVAALLLALPASRSASRRFGFETEHDRSSGERPVVQVEAPIGAPDGFRKRIHRDILEQAQRAQSMHGSLVTTDCPTRHGRTTPSMRV